MNRRQFLGSMLYGPLALSAMLGLGTAGSAAFAAHGAVTVPKTLVNLMLYGGADLRYLFAPAPDYDPVYVDQYWTARRNLYSGSYATYADMFASEYTLVTDPLTGVFTFGVHNTAGWLASEFGAGNWPPTAAMAPIMAVAVTPYSPAVRCRAAFTVSFFRSVNRFRIRKTARAVPRSKFPGETSTD